MILQQNMVQIDVNISTSQWWLWVTIGIGRLKGISGDSTVDEEINPSDGWDFF